MVWGNGETMSKRHAAGVLLIGLIIATLTASVGSAGARQPEDTRSEHQKTIDFWTPERISQAIPRDFVFDQSSGRFIPAAPGGEKGRPGGGGGGGGGDGGGDGTTVTSGTWDAGGTVENATGKVLFSLGQSLYVCSATVIQDTAVDRSLVLTAAHCVYDHGLGFVENFMFMPNFAAGAWNLSSGGGVVDSDLCTEVFYGCWTASSLVVHNGFTSAGAFNGTAIQYDFGVAVLEAGGHDNKLVETLGVQQFDFSAISKGTPVSAFGYPQAEAEGGGELLRYCAGGSNFDNRLFKLTYKLECDMTGGASGGGWHSGFDNTTGQGTVVSVNSYRYSGGSAMYGPKLNGNTQDVYDEAIQVVTSPDGVEHVTVFSG
jgi:hypothetical protein